jgi:DNA processing protein
MKQMSLLSSHHNKPFDISSFVVSSLSEMGAYELLWAREGATFKTLADIFRENPNSLPSAFVPKNEVAAMKTQVLSMIKNAGIDRFGIRVHQAGEYPERLRQAQNPVELLYYRGWWDLVETRCVAVVGSRNVSKIGAKRAEKLVKLLVRDNFTIVSGLAQGVDTVAHKTAISEKGNTIAVIGTPIHQYYPKENKDLQDFIATCHLLISQVPVVRYSRQDFRINRGFFPERNKTMSALTEATIIVEASNTSGTLIQARAALYQGRKLFILDSCFHNKDLTWPKKFEEKGAIRVRDYEDIRKILLP